MRSGQLLVVVLFLLIGTTTAAPASAQDATPNLLTLLTAKDSALFDAFNRCDIAAYETFFAEDVEFYHDYGGLTSGRKKLIEDIAGACARKELGRRELLPGTMEVHPIRNVGAIQMGSHRFFVRTPEGERPGAVARFVIVWRNTGAEWKIARVLSFDHRTSGK